MNKENKDQELVVLEKLGHLHFQLVDNLKEVLLGLQTNFFLAASILYEIKTKETYKGEDLSNEWTWKDFCERPDLPIPGRTPESRRRCADALIRIHAFYIVKKKYDQKALAPIGWTKLDMIVPFCEKANKKSVIEDWIGRARNLTINHLKSEMISDDKPTFDKLDCDHKEEKLIWYCPTCGLKSDQPMNPKNVGKTFNF